MHDPATFPAARSSLFTRKLKPTPKHRRGPESTCADTPGCGVLPAELDSRTVAARSSADHWRPGQASSATAHAMRPPARRPTYRSMTYRPMP
jgi:hypothetical protein